LASILLVAAALKSESLFASSTDLPWPLAALLVFAELALSGLLFSGVKPWAAWWAALVCFACFALVSGVKTWRGDADCGCLGALAAPPWVALVIDLSAVAALLWRYRDRHVSRPNGVTGWSQLPIAIGFALITVVGVKTGLSISTAKPALSGDDPRQWVGQRLPFLEEMDVGRELASGDWIVVFHRPGCARCAKRLSDARAWPQRDGYRIALVELRPSQAGIGMPREPASFEHAIKFFSDERGYSVHVVSISGETH